MIKERGYKATIDLRVSKLDYVRANTNWPNLSRIGRNPISRFVVFAPIVAQILIHEETHTYINDVLNLYHLHWAYWSLIFFSAAQIIYFLKCPSDIKLHPNRYEYIQALNNTSTDEELKNHSFHIIKKHFTKHGGLLDFSENKYEEVTRMLTLEEMRDKRFEASTVTDGEYTSNAIYIFRQSVRVGIPHKSIDWNTIEKALPFLSKALVDRDREETIVAFAHFKTDVETFATSSHWRIHVLNYKYKKQRNVTPNFIKLCALLYAIGVSYFIYAGITNVVRVLYT